MAASWQESRRRINGLADFADHDTGSIVWNASLVLLNHLRLKNAADFRGKRVLELGAGVGHLAWGLYELGAHVTASNTPLAGDLKELETCLDRWLGEEAEGKEAEASAYIRSALNNKAVEVPKVSGGSIRAVELTWGQAHWQNSPLSLESAAGAPPYDIIILAEVFSIPELHEELVWTLQQFCHADVVPTSLLMQTRALGSKFRTCKRMSSCAECMRAQLCSGSKGVFGRDGGEHHGIHVHVTCRSFSACS